MVVHILEREVSPVRFENFCIALCSEADQRNYLPTSRSYDLGRDAKGASPGSVHDYICCGIEADVIKKGKGDIDRLSNTSSPENLIFCFTSGVTEHKANQLEAYSRKKFPSLITVRTFGKEQLASLCASHPDPFETQYASELGTLRKALGVTTANPDEVELTGLRVALTTQLHDDAQTRRKDLVTNLLLTALANKETLTATMLAKKVSEQLRLPRLVNEGWFLAELNSLTAARLLEYNTHGYRITESGLQEIKGRTRKGTEKLLAGKETIEGEITTLTGSAPTSTEFTLVWKILEDGIVTMFISHGASIVESIISVSTGASEVHQHDDLRTNISRIVDRIRLIQGKGSGKRIAEIAQAVEDMFFLRGSPAFSWLAEVAEVFLQLCTLGLDPHAQEQFRARIREISLLLDTDIVLSLLSAGEANHNAVKTIIAGWIREGGTVAVSEPSLEEASHHAWISTVDFDKIAEAIDKYDDAQVQQAIGNVFVRGFRVEQHRRNKRCTRRDWGIYLSAFKGRHDHDWGKILELLKDEKIQHLPEEEANGPIASMLAQQIFLKQKNQKHYSTISQLKEKSDRDGRMIAKLITWRKSLPHGQTAVIVSASGGIRMGAKVCRNDLGPPEPILYIPALAWILSQVPGVSLAASTLKCVIFDVDFPIQLDPVSRMALRVLQQSDEYRIHFSRRGTLRDAMRDQISKIAAEEDKGFDEVYEEVKSNTDSGREAFTSVLAGAVDEISRSKSEKEISDLRNIIEKLQKKMFDISVEE